MGCSVSRGLSAFLVRVVHVLALILAIGTTSTAGPGSIRASFESGTFDPLVFRALKTTRGGVGK